MADDDGRTYDCWKGMEENGAWLDDIDACMYYCSVIHPTTMLI
jgi:hypothetical protein